MRYTLLLSVVYAVAGWVLSLIGLVTRTVGFSMLGLALVSVGALLLAIAEVGDRLPPHSESVHATLEAFTGPFSCAGARHHCGCGEPDISEAAPTPQPQSSRLPLSDNSK